MDNGTDTPTEPNTEAPAQEQAKPAAADGVPTIPLPPGAEKKWYIVNTYSGHENKAKLTLLERVKTHNLSDYFGDVLVPIAADTGFWSALRPGTSVIRLRAPGRARGSVPSMKRCVACLGVCCPRACTVKVAGDQRPEP